MLLWVERDDQHDPASPRVGEADIWVRRSDRARGTWLTVAYQERYQRFVDLTPASI